MFIVCLCHSERKFIILNVEYDDLVNVGVVNVRGCMIVFLIFLVRIDIVMYVIVSFWACINHKK